MLIGNGAVLGKHPGRDLGGGATGLGMNRGDANKSSMNRQRFTHTGWDALSGVPDGYRPEYAWIIPIAGGGMSARKNLAGAGDIQDLNLAGGLNAEAALAGAGDMTGTGALIVSLVAALTGSGTITSATAQAFLNLAAALAGSGDLAGAATAIGHAAAALQGAGDLTGTATALGELAAAITVTGDLLSTSNVGAAVWQALSAAFNEAGTMGAKLNSAASAGDPWTTDLPGAYVDGTAGFILGNLIAGLTPDQAEQLLNIAQIHGLILGSPLTVTSTSRESGAVTQTISEAGDTVTVTRT